MSDSAIAPASRTCDAAATPIGESHGNGRTETDERSGLVTTVNQETAVDVCARIKESTKGDELMTEQVVALLNEVNDLRATRARIEALAARWISRSLGDMWAQDRWFADELLAVLEGRTQ